MRAALVAVALLLPGVASAQATGTIVGTVRDTAGRPVFRAQIHVRGHSGEALTAADGRFRVSGVTGGSLPFGGSEMSEVRLSVRFAPASVQKVL